MFKLLFLDVDGVLNYKQFFEENPTSHKMMGSMIDPSRVSLVVSILERTGASLVLSSTWRIIPEGRKAINDAFGHVKSHIKPPIPCTPTHDPESLQSFKCRGEEIDFFLRKLDKWPATFAILDDDHDFLPHQMPFLVNTSWETGLLESHVEEAVVILNAGEKGK